LDHLFSCFGRSYYDLDFIHVEPKRLQLYAHKLINPNDYVII